jgi:hypothetical protein
MAAYNSNHTTLANQILKALSAPHRLGRYVTTSSLMADLGGVFPRIAVLEVCHMLKAVGTLQSRGTGKYRWMLLVTTIITDNPLRNLPADFTYGNGKGVLAAQKPVGTEQLTFLQEQLAKYKELLVQTARAYTELKEQKEVPQVGTPSVGQHVREIKISVENGPTVKLKDVVLPVTYDRTLALASLRRNILLVGPAGCGKTYLGELIARSLGLPFYSISCTAGMSETHLLGRAIQNIGNGTTTFQGTAFLDAYENGGVFLLDEIDAADSNLLLAINSAIANGYCNVPNRPENPRAAQHDDFVIIATANTFGRGAARMYAGRFQLDEASLDRFRIGTVECNYDRGVEEVLCPDETLRKVLWSIRHNIEQAGLRRILSTRFMIDAHKMLVGTRNLKGITPWTIEQIVEVFFEGWTNDERVKCDKWKSVLRGLQTAAELDMV